MRPTAVLVNTARGEVVDTGALVHALREGWIAAAGLDVTGWMLAPGLLVVGLGMGLVMGVNFTVTLKDVDSAHAGSASGTLSAVQQVGGAIGIALVGVIFFGGLSQGAGASFDAVAADVRAELVTAGVPAASVGPVLRDVRTCYVDRASAKDLSAQPASCRKVEAAGPDPAVGGALVGRLRTATANDFLGAYTAAMGYTAVLLATVTLLGLLLPRRIEFEMPSAA
jgi:hypothetical protein